MCIHINCQANECGKKPCPLISYLGCIWCTPGFCIGSCAMTGQIYTHRMVMNMNWDSSTTTRIGPCWSSILLRTAPTAKIDRDSANTVQPSRVIHGILLYCRHEPGYQQIKRDSNACCSYASYWQTSVIERHLPDSCCVSYCVDCFLHTAIMLFGVVATYLVIAAKQTLRTHL